MALSGKGIYRHLLRAHLHAFRSAEGPAALPASGAAQADAIFSLVRRHMETAELVSTSAREATLRLPRDDSSRCPSTLLCFCHQITCSAVAGAQIGPQARGNEARCCTRLFSTKLCHALIKDLCSSGISCFCNAMDEWLIIFNGCKAVCCTVNAACAHFVSIIGLERIG